MFTYCFSVKPGPIFTNNPILRISIFSEKKISKNQRISENKHFAEFPLKSVQFTLHFSSTSS